MNLMTVVNADGTRSILRDVFDATTSARNLSDRQLALEAAAAQANGHRCEECFGCVCSAVLMERRRAALSRRVA